MAEKKRIGNRLYHFFGPANWQNSAVIVIIIIFLAIQMNFAADYKQLPGPIYGGDFYYHLGVITHLSEGGSIFENAQAAGEYPWTPPLYHITVVLFSILTGLEPLKAQIYSNIIFTILVGIVSYFTANIFLKNKTLSLAFASYILAIYSFFFHYHAAMWITTLLFLGMLFYSYNYKKTWMSILAGVSYGLVLLSHASRGIAATFVLFLYFGYIAFVQYFSIENKKLLFRKKLFKEELKDNLKYCIIVFSVGFIIGLLFWLVPIFVFHLATPNMLQEYTYPRMDSLSIQLKTGFSSLFSLFKWNLASILTTIMAIFFTIGLILIVILKKTKETKYLIFLFLASLIGMFHPLVTKNLFGFMLTIDSLGFFSTIVFFGIIALFGLKIIADSLFKKKSEIAFIIFLAVVLIFGISQHIKGIKGGYYYQNALSEMPPYFNEITEWTKENTGVNDVFLTNNEDGFMFNALTGRKLLTSRRGHLGMFVDVDKRYVDAAIILYGKNDVKRVELLKKNNVKYLFWHYRWLQNEFNFNDKGEIVGLFDPILIQDKEDYEEQLKENNVTYRKMHTWLDAALRGDDYLQYDVLLVYPEMNMTHPWNNQLDKYLILEKTFYAKDNYGNNFEVAKIFRVNV